MGLGTSKLFSFKTSKISKCICTTGKMPLSLWKRQASGEEQFSSQRSVQSSTGPRILQVGLSLVTISNNQKINKKGHTDYKNLDELLNPAATLSVGVEVARVGAAEPSCGEDVGATRTTFPHKKSVFESVLISVMIQPFASCF